MNNGVYTEAQEAEILKRLVEAMRTGKVKNLKYGTKTKAANSKQYVCEMTSPVIGITFSAQSEVGVHDLGFLFIDNVRSALGMTMEEAQTLTPKLPTSAEIALVLMLDGHQQHDVEYDSGMQKELVERIFAVKNRILEAHGDAVYGMHP